MLEGVAADLQKNDKRLPSIMAAAEAHRRAGLAAVTGKHYEGGHWLGSFAVYLVIDDCDAWTLNASLTRLSSYRKCSKRRILGHSAQATSRLPIEGTTKCSRTALGLGFGSDTESVAEPSPLCFD